MTRVVNSEPRAANVPRRVAFFPLVGLYYRKKLSVMVFRSSSIKNLRKFVLLLRKCLEVLSFASWPTGLMRPVSPLRKNCQPLPLELRLNSKCKCCLHVKPFTEPSLSRPRSTAGPERDGTRKTPTAQGLRTSLPGAAEPALHFGHQKSPVT